MHAHCREQTSRLRGCWRFLTQPPPKPISFTLVQHEDEQMYPSVSSMHAHCRERTSTQRKC
jgi:hypothetical protein